jgi:hypothetical protein
VTLESFETACNKKNKQNSDDDASSDGKGNDNAPGQNKDKADKANKGGKDNAPGQNKVKGDDSSSDD